MFSSPSSFLRVLVSLFLLSAWATAVAAEDEAAQPAEAVFEMREFSLLDTSRSDAGARLNYGIHAVCSTEPNKEVKAYPKLKSAQPLYGKLQLDRDPAAPASGKAIDICFVLDESDEATSEEKPEEKKAEQNEPKSTAAPEAKPAEAEKPKPAVQPLEKAPQSRYDRLYIDLYRDLDLTNDPAVMPMKDPPWKAMPATRVKERTIFDCLDIDVDYGPELGVRPFRVLPWFSVDVGHVRLWPSMKFTPTTAREGRIRIGNHECDAVLTRPHWSSCFDHPMSILSLKPVDPQDKTWLRGAMAYKVLKTVYRLDGTFYTTSATPLGDKLTVKPYRGDLGVVAVGPGDRDIKDISFQGVLASETMILDLAREPAEAENKQDEESPEPKPEKVREYKVPVGDYMCNMWIEYGRLRFGIDATEYEGDMLGSQENKPLNHFIKIRKDTPFVLDFSHKPVILFARPPGDKTFKLGDTVTVRAALVDPLWDITIGSLRDASKKVTETRKQPDGKEVTIERDLSLDPVVAITDSTGKRVAEGTMPFG